MLFSDYQLITGHLQKESHPFTSSLTLGVAGYRYHDMLPISNSASLIHSSIAYSNDIFAFVFEFASF